MRYDGGGRPTGEFAILATVISSRPENVERVTKVEEALGSASAAIAGFAMSETGIAIPIRVGDDASVGRPVRPEPLTRVRAPCVAAP
jgi:hypothetical protein